MKESGHDQSYLVQYLCNTRVHTVMRLPKDRGGMLVLVVHRRLIGQYLRKERYFQSLCLPSLAHFCLVSAEYAGFIP